MIEWINMCRHIRANKVPNYNIWGVLIPFSLLLSLCFFSDGGAQAQNGKNKTNTKENEE
jgi:hypothetical protein